MLAHLLIFLLHTTEKNNYLNFAERPAVLQEYEAEEIVHIIAEPEDTIAKMKEAVWSLGPLRCVCYQRSARGLSTRSSAWDLVLFYNKREDSSWERLRA